MLGRQRPERLVGEPEDPLRADVEPTGRRHLSVHGQTGLFEPPEGILARPLRHDHRSRDEDPGRVRMRREDGDGLPRLDDQRLVRAQALEHVNDLGGSLRAPGRTPAAAVDDERVSILGDVRVEVVEEAAERPFLLPATAPELAAPGSAAEEQVGHARIVPGRHSRPTRRLVGSLEP